VIRQAAKPVLVALCATLCSCRPRPETAAPPRPQAPAIAATAAPQMPAGVFRLSGSPEEIGRQHGTVLREPIRIMLSEYLRDDTASGTLDPEMLARVRRMKPSLPTWYLQELQACAKAAGIDEDLLLFAQCEGDIRSLGGCTTYVALGAATADGALEIGRNFDYWGLESPEKCAVILSVVPRPEDGYAFVSVGWSGILGGWTFINEKGLFVANNLGGFYETNPEGIPTLIMERIIAQKAATVAEAVAIIKSNPRMRGQVLVLGQAGDAAQGRQPHAVVVAYGAQTVEVQPPVDGLAFHSSMFTPRAQIARGVAEPDREPMDTIRSAGSSITLHSVAIRPQEHRLWVAHGTIPSAHQGKYTQYDLRALLRRDAR